MNQIKLFWYLIIAERP